MDPDAQINTCLEIEHKSKLKWEQYKKMESIFFKEIYV